MADWFDEAATLNAVAMADLFLPGVQDTVHSILENGALVSFGVSRDGGALGVTITVDGRWRREWFRDAVQLIAWLESCLRFLENDRRESRATSDGSGGQRPRRRAVKGP